MRGLRINREPVTPENTLAVYIAKRDAPIFFPRSCIEVNCPGTGTDYAVELAEDARRKTNPKNEQQQLAGASHGIDRTIADMAHSITEVLAESAVDGTCELALANEGCWRRQHDRFNLFDLLRRAGGVNATGQK